MEQADTAELELFAADGTKFVPLKLHLTPVLDQPPSLVWSLPDDEAVATPQTLLRVAAQVQDDYGVKQIVLRAVCEAEGLEMTFPLHLAAEPPGVRQRASSALPEEPSPAALPDTADVVALDTALPLSGWPARPGQVWTLSLQAHDFKPQTAQTPPRRLRIVSVAELKQLLAARRQAVLDQLVEALRHARQLRDELAQARQRAERAFTPEDALRLQAIQYGLVQVADTLAAGPSGAEEKLAALLAELRAHGLAEDAQEQPLAQWLNAVRALNQEAIPAVERRLAEAQEAAQAALASAPGDAAQQGRVEVAASLAAAHDEHSKLVRSLEEMLGVAQRWEALARMARQVSELERHQQALTGQIEEVQLQALNATAEQAAALRALGRRLAQQQADLARHVEELHATAEQMASQPAADDPDAAARLQAAHSALRQSAIGSTMRQGAMQLAQGQYDAAAALARQALEKLRHLDAIFQGTKPPTAAVPAPAASATWQTPLAALIASQQELATSVAQLDAAGASPPAGSTRPTSRELAARQGRLAHELETLRPHMPRLFQWVAEEAHRAMRRCQQLLEAGQTGAATQQAAQNALELLQQLHKAGAGDTSRPGAATEPSAPPDASASPDDPRLAELKLVLLWQEWIARQTAAMQRQRPPDGSWTPAQRDAIEDLARQQQRLAQALQTISEAPAKPDAAQP